MLKSVLPEIYTKLFEEEILNFNIEEKKATCDSCALSNGKSPDKRNYLPNLKCCTFQPFQTNFSIGQILSDSNTNEEIINKIKTKIEKREYTLPIGILASIPNQIEFNKNKEKFFGKKEDWLCPYYSKSENNCGIWKYRSSVCTSFHCLSSYGKKGFEFWGELQDFISYIEMIFMEEALTKSGFKAVDISEQIYFLNEFKKAPKEKFSYYLEEEFYSKIWKKYYQNEILYYKKTAEIINNFSKTKFKKLLGEKGTELEKNLILNIKIFGL